MSAVRKVATALASLVLILTAQAVLAPPANAAGHYIGGTLSGYGCNGNAGLNYRGNFRGACYRVNTDIANLSCCRFDIHGPESVNDTAGLGVVVRNHAAAMSCSISPLNGCRSWFYPNFQGNYDWEYWGEIGTLFFTWNDGASIQLY